MSSAPTSEPERIAGDGQPLNSSTTRPFSVFVFELVSAGFFGESVSPSFRAEGRAMLEAVLADFRRIPGVSVKTILEADASQGEGLLERVARHGADAVLIIAPELDGLLERFCRAGDRAGGLRLNCSAEAISLGSDKLRLARHLTAHNIPTIPTELIDLDDPPPRLPCVVKPRDGAGSWLVRRVETPSDWACVLSDYLGQGRTQALVQPYLSGMACSIAALTHPGKEPEILPLAAQYLSDDGTFRYLGGQVPAPLPVDEVNHVRRLMRRVLETIPGLNGYVSCDVLVRVGAEPLIVELNPRLTTSYIGYRRLTDDNLMLRLLDPHGTLPPIRWRNGSIRFRADGTCPTEQHGNSDKISGGYRLGLGP